MMIQFVTAAHLAAVGPLKDLREDRGGSAWLWLEVIHRLQTATWPDECFFFFCSPPPGDGSL